MEISEGLEKEGDWGYKRIFPRAVVQDPLYGILLRLYIILEFSGRRWRVLCCVQVTKFFQDAGGTR